MKLLAIATLFCVLGAGLSMAQDDWDDWEDEGGLPVEIHGFVEYAVGGRVVSDATQPDDMLLNEARFRLCLLYTSDAADE